MSLKWAAVAAVATILGLAHGGSVRVKRADAGAWTPDLSGLNSDQLIKMINAGLAQKQRRSAPAPVMSALPPRSTFERNARASNLQAMYDNFYSNEGLNGERGYGPNANANMLNQMNMGLYKRSTPNSYNLRSYKMSPTFNGKRQFSLPFTIFKRSAAEVEAEQADAPSGL